MYVLFENLSEKYNKNWEKISNITKKEFNSKHVRNKKCLNTEKKSTQNKKSSNQLISSHPEIWRDIF